MPDLSGIAEGKLDETGTLSEQIMSISVRRIERNGMAGAVSLRHRPRDGSAGPPTAANDNDPYLMMALGDIEVRYGTMQQDRLDGFADLVCGDGWSFAAPNTLRAADVVEETCCTSVRTRAAADAGSNCLVIGRSAALVLMSDRAEMLACRFVMARDRRQSFILLPRDLDRCAVYELIFKGGLG